MKLLVIGCGQCGGRVADEFARLNKKARSQRGIDINDWHFVSASAETMRELSTDIGFSYFSSPKGFDHMIQATVLDSKGTVYRQIYGMAPDAPSLVEPLRFQAGLITSNCFAPCSTRPPENTALTCLLLSLSLLVCWCSACLGG